MGWMRRVKGFKKKKKDNSVMIARRKRGWRDLKRVKGDKW